MSRKKGLSIEEKRTKLLEIFHETKDVYQLKDLEKIAPKAKGIVENSVKVILEELVSDGMVESAKIGSSIFFWSFPGKAKNDLKRKIGDLEKRNFESDKRIQALEQWIELEGDKDADVQKIESLKDEIKKLTNQESNLIKELEKCNDLDPEAVKKKETETKSIIEATNRWTDNIFSIKTWCKQKFSLEEKDLDKNFKIPEDFDYIE